MPQISDDEIKVKVVKSGSDSEVAYRTTRGTTFKEFITDDLQARPEKFTVVVNGNPLNKDELNSAMRDGDHILLRSANYDSGI